jgi:uncharacterized protein YegJ (DUF2314 family)
MRLIIASFGFATLFMVSTPLFDAKCVAADKAPDIVPVAENDKEMNAAMEKARKSIEDFIRVFLNRQKSQSDFGVKVAIREGKEVEHFWVAISRFDGNEFDGEIGNTPMVVKTVKTGDKIKVRKDTISDWMYVENNRLVGGYTVRILRNRLSLVQRKALDDSVPYKIE